VPDSTSRTPKPRRPLEPNSILPNVTFTRYSGLAASMFCRSTPNSHRFSDVPHTLLEQSSLMPVEHIDESILEPSV